MMSAPRLSRERKHEIINAYLAGEKVDLIAAQFGVHHTYPGILAKRYGKTLRGNLKPSRKIAIEQHPEIKKMFKLGVPRTLIARLYGVDRTQIYRIAKAT